ncbi:hypothetical protein [Mucilaginibacter glaciei]|uniref:Uncharacterized protein n=1 Tax=Mucilaginibacter glaciei TaxID=2772109 RepID=A0A926S0Q1_9SPHI|nr:hypothetical protein [Mucilaginibacter glaciei]MBD1393205.1 hypothetical protein [Mucilaginibacter glaciei]
MEKEYKISVLYKIVYGIFITIIFGFAVFLTSEGLKKHHSTSNYISGVLAFVIGAVWTLYLKMKRVIIAEDAVEVISLFGSCKVYADGIKGFRVMDKLLIIYLINGERKKLRIYGPQLMDKSEEMIAQLSNLCPDLDTVEYQQEMGLILNDNALGYSENERNEKLESAKRKALIFNIGGGVLFVGCFFRNYGFIVCLMTFFYPLIGIFLIISGKGLIKFFTKNNSPLPSVYVGMYIPSMVLLIVTIIDYHIINHSDVWVPFLLISSVLIIVISIKGITKKGGAAQFVILLVIALFYGYGSTLMINCGFDQSAPQIFDATVVDKYKTKDVPYVKISDWGSYKESGEIKILNSFYEQVQIGSTIKVNSKRGGLNIPWYYIPQ